MKRIYPLLLLILSSAQLQAQKNIELGAGLGYLMRQDMTITPMVDQAVSPINARIAFDWKKNNRNIIEARFGQYKTSASDEYTYFSEFGGEENTANRHKFIRVELNYAYLFDMGKIAKLTWSLGAESRNRLIAGWHDFAVFDEQFTYNFSFGLDAVAVCEYPMNEKHSFAAQINLPVFAYSARNPYLSQDSKWMEDNMNGKALSAVYNMIGNSTLRSWGSYRTFDLALSWQNQLTEKWSFGARYMFCGIRNSIPTKYTSFENVLHLTLKRVL